jgi:hypothetical protein
MSSVHYALAYMYLHEEYLWVSFQMQLIHLRSKSLQHKHNHAMIAAGFLHARKKLQDPSGVKACQDAVT